MFKLEKVVILVLCISVICLAACEKTKSDDSANNANKTENKKEENLKQNADVAPFNAVLDIGAPVEEGRFPVFPIWETVVPRKRGCAARQNTKVTVLEEADFNGERFFKVETPKCTGYIPSKYVKATN